MAETNEVREFRTYRRNGKLILQYGVWHRPDGIGMNARFAVYREWACNSVSHAIQLKDHLAQQVLIDPELRIAPEETAMKRMAGAARSVAQLPPDSLLALGIQGLIVNDPLPPLDELHAELKLRAPKEVAGGGRQFYTVLPGPAYQRLCAMAVAAGCSRNKMLEAILMAAEAIAYDSFRTRRKGVAVEPGAVATAHSI